ncbi:hypothetical protein ACFOOK_27510 [Micromonospora krabiensis]|uniref:Uncharacterized protein n=1 Tax=Micromonospora krabiensis TaxID=307121 RepID=A0A1C3N532_9ACTN|nr:hypothetical protein [Micromonospora krabiensis]SBV27684.1 hypothetical protein GA0070620_3210 [Micromonospora krabiensis]
MRSARLVGLILAAAAVVLWAVNMTVLQPLTEPIGPWSENLPGNNAYWARDLRFATIVAVVLALVLAGRGDRRWAGPAVLLGGVWVVADVAVDRADPTGAAPTVLLAVGGCAVLAALVVFLVRRTAAPSAVERAVGGADRRVPAVAASVAGVLAIVAAGIESPTDREPELNTSAFATAALLIVVALGCALAAAPAPTWPRRWAAVATVAATLLVVGWVRTIAPEDGRLLPGVLLGGVLLTGVTVVAWDWPDGRPDWGRHGLAAFATLIGPTAMLLAAAVAMMLLPVAAPFTALAGNSPINSADSDVLLSLAGVLAGLGMSLLLAWPPALAGRPAAPAPTPNRPVGPQG